MRRKFFQTLRSLLKKYFHLDLDEILSLFKHPVMWWSAIVLFALAIVFITTFSIQRVPDTLIVGQIANSDIKADRDYEIIDEEVTEAARKEALDDVPPVYNFIIPISFNITIRNLAYDKSIGNSLNRKRGDKNNGECKENNSTPPHHRMLKERKNFIKIKMKVFFEKRTQSLKKLSTHEVSRVVDMLLQYVAPADGEPHPNFLIHEK